MTLDRVRELSFIEHVVREDNKIKTLHGLEISLFKLRINNYK